MKPLLLRRRERKILILIGLVILGFSLAPLWFQRG